MKKSAAYRPDIQGLRALAVILVIVFHADVKWLPGGFVGVDVFFVISGFLITSLLLRERESTGTIRLNAFYARRCRRLLPAAALVILATMVVAWFSYSPLDLKQFASTAVATSVYLSNVWFAMLQTDYLAEGAANSSLLLHTWSLGVEEQFYLAWPLLLLLVASYALKFRRSPRIATGIAVAAVFIASFAFSAWLTYRSQPWAFFGSPTRAWEFAMGGLGALWLSANPKLHGSRYMFILGIGLLAAASLLFDERTTFPGLMAAIPATAAFLIIVAGHARPNAVLATRPAQLIGDMSYSLYLWHWPLLLLLAEYGKIGTLLAVALTFAASYVTLIWIENPIRFGLQLQPRQALYGGLGVILVCAALASGVRSIAAINLQSPSQVAIAAAANDIPTIYADNCHVPAEIVDPPNCVYGDPESNRTVVLFGDSHAAHWFPALEALASRNRWKLVSLTKSGCPSVVFEPFNRQTGRPYVQCTLWRNRAIERIAEIQPFLTIVSNFAPESHESESAVIAALLSRIAPESRSVVLIRDVPLPATNIPSCLSRAAWIGIAPDCRLSAASESVYLAQLDAASSYENVHVVDLTPAICDSFPCSGVAGDQIKYSDSSHLTRSFSASLADDLEAALALIPALAE